MNRTKTLGAVIAFGLIMMTQSCTKANSDEQTASPQDLYAKIQEAASNQGCTSSADCGLLPMGAKPCGGPEAYIAYSKNNSDEAKLQKMAQSYKESRQKYNEENQMMGTCVVTPKPRVSCVRNQCMTSEQSTIIQ